MEASHEGTLLTSSELTAWIRDWVASTTGVAAGQISVDAPLQSLGLSSRDAVILSGELERLIGKKLDPTIAYEHPTIAGLARQVAAVAASTPAAAPAAASGVAAGVGRAAAGPETHDIAIVGLAVRFPQAEDLAQFWRVLETGQCVVGELPVGRWSEYSGEPVLAKKMQEQPMLGGYLADISSFDAEFFGLSPLEAANMDPQQRLALELAWEALEHANIPANTLRGENVGVFVGSSNNDYGMLIAADPAEANPYALTGTASSIVANRISYCFDFQGPSLQVDTACSSTLVAVHQAVSALRNGEADVALAGGINIMASPFVSTAFGELGVISPSGAIRAFSEDADGFVRSDGGGLFVLKRVGDALAAGDNILAVIRGSAVNSDGRSNGLTAPNPAAQAAVLAKAYADAGVEPQLVDYVEAHGTGTILGDPIEAHALGQVVGCGREVHEPLLLGSAKTNFGHAESAAGAAGLAKVVLGMQHGILPQTVNFAGPNPYIDFDAEHLEVVEDPREWPCYSGAPLAGVSGFGFGGTNAHVVVSSFTPERYAEAARPVVAAELPAAPSEEAPVLLPLSGLIPSRRKAAAAAVREALAVDETADLVAWQRALARRNHGRSRAVVQAASRAQALHQLEVLASGKRTTGVDLQDAPAAVGPLFVYSGFGSQHRKMAKELLHTSPFFAARLEELSALVEFEVGYSLVELVETDELNYTTETAQVAITAIQIALTDLLAHFGVKPAAVAGMSMGELAAAYAAGGLSAADVMRVACHRARLMGEGEASLPEDQLGAMAVVELGAAELETAIAAHPEYAGIEPAVYAGPGMTTVGGPRAAVTALVEALQGEGKFSRLLDVKGAGHTSAVEPLLGELAAEAADITPLPLTIPLYSSVDQGVVYQPGQVVHDADYWLRCTRGSVWFQTAIEGAFAAGHEVLVEVSPSPVALMGMMNTAFAAGKPDAKLLYTLKRKVPPVQSLRDLLAKLYVTGVNVDFTALDGTGALADAPRLTWKKQRFWTAARPASGGHTPLPGTKVALPDGQVAYSIPAEQVPSLLALLEAATDGLQLASVNEAAALPASGELTTVVTKIPGGVTVRCYRVLGDTLVLLAEALAVEAQLELAGAAFGGPQVPAAAPADAEPDPNAPVLDDSMKWDPASGESVEQRLRSIVSESMGYDMEDLPGELPLIDLGLDSLMGMRIKNRIEHEFSLPPLQVQALRDASVQDVVTLVEDLVAGRSGSAGAAAAEPVAAQAEPAAAADAAEVAVPDYGVAEGVGVAPRDASERLVFATWAQYTGKAAAGMTSKLPPISEEVAAKIAARLTERAEIEITTAEVLAAETLEPLSDHAREGLETEVEGNIRVLRARPEGSTKPAVFMFHPAGGSSVVYQPLMRRLPADVPVYGVERLEGSLAERASQYLDEIKTYSDGLPIILGGWSFGGALAYEVAHQLVGSDVKVAYIALLDTVQPAEPIPDTMEETKARWQRYQAFAKKTYNLDFPVPYDLLETAGEDALLQMMAEFLATTDASAHGLAAGVLEHQRASFVDNRILDKLDMHQWEDVDVPVVLFRAERMHDGAIELEPHYAKIDPDGGWATIVADLEIVQLKGDHLAVIDEPEIGKVGAKLSALIAELD